MRTEHGNTRGLARSGDCPTVACHGVAQTKPAPRPCLFLPGLVGDVRRPELGFALLSLRRRLLRGRLDRLKERRVQLGPEPLFYDFLALGTEEDFPALSAMLALEPCRVVGPNRAGHVEPPHGHLNDLSGPHPGV